MTAAFVKLADPSHKLPWPYVRGRFFSPEGETVDLDDAFWHRLLVDGSIVLADAPAAAPEKTAPSAPTSDPATAPAAAEPIAPEPAAKAAPTVSAAPATPAPPPAA